MFVKLGPWEIAIILSVLFVLPVYFTPTIIAAFRKVENLLVIIIVNTLAGWTFIGWAGTLVWAITARKKTEQPDSLGNI